MMFKNKIKTSLDRSNALILYIIIQFSKIIQNNIFLISIFFYLYYINKKLCQRQTTKAILTIF